MQKSTPTFVFVGDDQGHPAKRPFFTFSGILTFERHLKRNRCCCRISVWYSPSDGLCDKSHQVRLTSQGSIAFASVEISIGALSLRYDANEYRSSIAYLKVIDFLHYRQRSVRQRLATVTSVVDFVFVGATNPTISTKLKNPQNPQIPHGSGCPYGGS
jgi:hypothetical protein